MSLSFRKVLAKLLFSGYVYSSVVQLFEFIKKGECVATKA